MGDLEEFENAVKLVTRDVSFDTDIIVSLFETNIRMLGWVYKIIIVIIKAFTYMYLMMYTSDGQLKID